MATIGSADGDTGYVLTAPLAGQPALVLPLGNNADGRRLFVANVDATPNQVQVECHGSEEGVSVYLLTGKGDYIYIPAGDITLVHVYASAYPTTIAFANLRAHMDIGSGQKR